MKFNLLFYMKFNLLFYLNLNKKFYLGGRWALKFSEIL